MIQLKIAKKGSAYNVEYQKVTSKTAAFAKNFAKNVAKILPESPQQDVFVKIKDKPVRRLLRELFEMRIDDMKLNFDMKINENAAKNGPKIINSYVSGEEFNLLSQGKYYKKSTDSFIGRIKAALADLNRKG